MSKHTPGPWEIPHDDSPYWSQMNAVPIVFTGSALADVRYNGRYDEWIANARLIAAAPQMYDALKALLRVVADFVNGDREIEANRVQQAWDEAQAALAAADGGDK